jgi:hypothetical protein
MYHNTAPYVDWIDHTDEDIHRITIDAEYFAPFKMSIATDSYGNKEVYRYVGFTMLEQTELEAFHNACCSDRVTERNSDTREYRELNNYMKRPKPKKTDYDD